MKKIFLLLSAISLIICLFISCNSTTPPPPTTNYTPTINSTPITSATVGEEYIYEIDATDLDGDTLTYFLTIKPADMSINYSTGQINWTPTIDQIGDNNVTVEVFDDGSPVKSTTQSFTIHVEEPPEPVEELYYNVPYVAQPAGSQLCGVASSIMVLNYYDKNLSMSTFGPTITTNGKLDIIKLQFYLMDIGYTFDPFRISESQGIDEVIDVLERGPVMLWQKHSLTTDFKHHRVLIGYDNNEEEFISHDPSRGKDFKMSYDEFFDLSFNYSCYFFEIRPENRGEKFKESYQ